MVAKDSVTCIDLVRHGEVATPGLFCALPTEPLSAKGWQQLRSTTHYIGGRYDAIVSSPSRRCAEFAQVLGAEISCEPEMLKGVQEMDFGHWVGRSTADIWQQDEALLQCLWQTPLDFAAPRGESMVDFVARVQSAWRDILIHYAGQNVLVLTHGGVIRILLALALDIPYRNTLGFELAYGSASRFKVYPDGAVSVWGVGVKQLIDTPASCGDSHDT